MEEGPNGTHLCTVSQFAGPSVGSMSRWSKRLRGDLARRAAKQVATVVKLMHSAGVVHGGSSDLHLCQMYRRSTTALRSDIEQHFFRVTDLARRWSDSEIYSILGEPETEQVLTVDDSPPEPHAPPRSSRTREHRHSLFPILLGGKYRRRRLWSISRYKCRIERSQCRHINTLFPPRRSLRQRCQSRF